jgi:hypothetical protein
VPSSPVAAAATTAARPVIHAPPASAIDQLSITADGTAALSTDAADGGRLWPSLDGTAEPVVLDLPVARAAAIQRVGSGFAVAVIDEAGGLVVEALGRDGGRIARASLAAEPPATDVIATAAGAIVARADQTLTLVDWSGAVVAQLAGDPGERLVDLAGNDREAIAAVDDGSATRVRRVVVGTAALGWGDTVPGVDRAPIALSPSGDRVARLVPRGIDDGTGGSHTVVTDRAGRVVFDAPTPGASRLGFVDEDHVAALARSTIYWVGSGSRPLHRGFALPAGDTGFATGSGVAVEGLNLDVVVSTRDADAYLGYGLVAPVSMAAGSAGTVMVAGEGGVEALDAALQDVPARRIDLTDQTAVAIQHLVGDDWFVEAHASDGPRAYVARDGSAAGVDVGSGELATAVVFEPATRLLALSGQHPRVFRYEPSERAFTAIPLPRDLDDVSAWVTPTDPGRAGGAHLVVATGAPTPPKLTWYGDDAAATTVAMMATGLMIYYGADRIGRAFVWAPTAVPKRLVVYQRAQTVAELAFDGRMTLSTEPTGTRFVAAGPEGVTAFDATGRPLWHRDVDASGQPAWLDDDTLAVPTPVGVVKLAAATGAVLAARCGLRFGKTQRPHPSTPRGVSACAELAR